VKPVTDLLDGEDLHPRCRKLDGQSNAVESLADVRDGLHLLVRRRDGRHSCSPFDEQPDRIERQQAFRLELLRGRQPQRWNPPHGLTRNAQRFAARGENANRRRVAQHGLGQFCTPFDRVLAVVQNQEHVTGPKPFDQYIDRRRNSSLWYLKCARDDVG
jgi:hypothetical protein